MEYNNITHEQERFNLSNTKDGSLESVIAISANSIEQSQGNPKSLATILGLIKTSTDFKEKIEHIRSEEDEQKQKALKTSTLPWFSLGEYKNHHRSNRDFISTRFLIHDLDYVKIDLTKLRNQLQNDPYVLADFLSPRGNGLKVICELEQPITSVEKFKEVYQYYANEFQKKYGITPDPNGEKATQPCYYSFDPELYINPNHLKLPVIEQPSKPKQIPVIEAAMKGAETGGRTHNAARQVGFYLKKGFSKEITLTHVLQWNEKNNPPLEESKITSTVEDMYKRYDKLPVKYFEKDGSYYKNVYTGTCVKQVQMTTFTIQPKELLTLPHSDCLRCNVTSNEGYVYENILVENTDWHSKSKLLKAIGHQDCSILGSENEIQALCSYVNAQVETRKKGTKIVGLIDNTWVAGSLNITASGIISEPTIIPYEKGADAFYKQIEYQQCTPAENYILVSGLCNDLFQINTPEVVIPIIGWMFATPLKPLVMNKTGAFPILFLHGSQGSGKTSTAEMFMRMHGHKSAKPTRCSLKPFPLLKMLSSTNAIPVVLDEFKVADLKEDIVHSLLRTLRESYNGEVESKGHQDQTVQDYKLDAPIVLAGEWSINQPAIKERIILVRFTDVVKKNKTMQWAFQRLLGMNLELFIPAYISFCLNQDIKVMYADSKAIVENHFISRTVAPRIIHNLSVMVLGLELFQSYATSLGLKVPDITLDNILDSQLEEITGNKTGFVKSAIDQMIEELGIMAQKNEKEPNPASAYKPTLTDVPWYKTARIKNTEVLAINFTRIFPEFKEHCRRTKYEGDLLDKESYLKLFDECSYVVEKNHPVNYGNNTSSKRSLCIDIQKAKNDGLNLDGFGIN